MSIRNRGYYPRSKDSVRKSWPWSPFIIAVLSVVSALPATAVEKTLYSFNSFPPSGVPDTGVNPDGTLLRDASGALYGAAMLGGAYYNGTIFKLTPPAAG